MATEYDYDIEQHIGGSWERVHTETSMKAARVSIAEYRSNALGVYRIRKTKAA